MNYEFNLLHHVGVVARRVRAAVEPVAHEEDDKNPSGPTGREGQAGKGLILLNVWV